MARFPFSDISDRFWSKVDKNGPRMPHMKTRCWVWTAATQSDGYGSFFDGQSVRLAHRWVFQEDGGSVLTRGVVVMHECDNPPCVRPSHLVSGSQIDNIRDRDRKGRTGRSMGVRGEDNVNALLTEAEVLEIRSLWQAGGCTKVGLGIMFGVTDSAIRKIVRRESWAHI